MKTLRLLIPQWQGGYDESDFPGQIYPLGARMLAWLAPDSDAPLIEVPVIPYTKGSNDKDGGVFWKKEIIQQIKSTRKIIDAFKPDRIIAFGGDCLISQAPFAYLNEHYNGNLGLIWIDAHPDISTPKDFDHAHAMVLGNLLGEGEAGMAQEVKKPFKAEQVLFLGVDKVLPYEKKSIERLGLKSISSKEISNSSQSLKQWIKDSKFEHLALHLDLDVLDPAYFRSILFCNPDLEQHIEAEKGKLKMQDLTRILKDISEISTVVGISFAEHMPWDALNLKKMLAGLSFMK